MEKATFKNRTGFRRWLENNYSSRSEIWIVFYKKHLKKGLSYDDAVEETLCFGWIDGILKRIDDRKHIIRFSPRRKNSMWSSRNIDRARKMKKKGKMKKAGMDKIPKKGDKRIYKVFQKRCL